MFKAYDTTGYDLSDDVEVYIEGEKVPVHSCYVSKYPINVRWPGRQREKYQRVISYYVNFEAEGEVAVKVIYKREVKKAVLKPIEKSVTPTANGKEITFTLDKEGGYVLTLDGYVDTVHFFYNPPKEYEVDKNDENVLYFAKGEYYVGTLQLKSNQTVYIEDGAAVFGIIHGEGVENVRIIGKGTLDVSETHEEIYKPLPYIYDPMFETDNATREHTLQFKRCKNIVIDGITIKDSLVYNIATWACDNVSINNVKIIGDWRYNTDGIDLHNTTNACVTNCFLRTFDDSLCVKAHLAYYKNNYENVVFDNCVVWNDWGNALHVGVETQAEELKNITFKNCYVIRGTGNALNVTGFDYAEISNVRYENISVELDDDCQPIILQSEYAQPIPEIKKTDYAPRFIVGELFAYHEYSAWRERGYGKSHDVVFDNVRLYTAVKPQIRIDCKEKGRIYDYTFKDVFVNGEKIKTVEDLHIEGENYENIKVE